MTVLKVPDLSLVVLVGVTGSGKSTFAARHFASTEVISSDFCRGLVSDDSNDQSATADAFDVLNFIAAKRLAAGRLTVIDATNVQPGARKPLIELAKRHHVLSVAIVLDVPEATCAARNASRPDREFGPHVVRQQHAQLRRGLRGLRREGFHRVLVLDGAAEPSARTYVCFPVKSDFSIVPARIRVPTTSAGTATSAAPLSTTKFSVIAPFMNTGTTNVPPRGFNGTSTRVVLGGASV